MAEWRMVSHGIELGFARPCDAQALALMSRDLIETGLGWGYRHETMLRFIHDPEVVVLAARANRQPVGFAVMKFGDERAHLVLLAVLPKHQRHGIARGMIAWLVETAQTAGIMSVHVELRASNEAAYLYYRSVGFSEVLRVPGYYQGRETALRMIRVLRKPGAVSETWRPPTLDKY